MSERRIKCKDCQKWIKSEHICKLKHNVHSPGKKRWCDDFFRRIDIKEKIPVIRVPWMSRWDKRKARLKAQHDMQKQKDMQKLIDQQKLIQEASATSETMPIQGIKGDKGIKGIKGVPVSIKKPSIFQKFFRRRTP